MNQFPTGPLDHSRFLDMPHTVAARAGGPRAWSVFKKSANDITARGPRMTVLINGQKMVDVQDTKHTRGPTALQYGAGTVKFRNVRLRTF
jgi:hypothetical protein